MYLELPKWIAEALERESNKSVQYIVKKILREYLVSKEGEELRERIRKEEEVYLDYWDDFPRTETHYHLYADILNSDTLEETQVYKDQVEKVIHSLKVLQQSEKEFLDYIKTLK